MASVTLHHQVLGQSVDTVLHVLVDQAVNLKNFVTRELEIRQAIHELEGLSDENLADMGLVRKDIAKAVRQGR